MAATRSFMLCLAAARAAMAPVCQKQALWNGQISTASVHACGWYKAV